MERIVLHLDMDAFFAAIEERDKPRLKGLPIVVGADPKDGKGRGVVATANYKAREYGTHSAQPISIAWRLSEEAARRGKPRAVFIGGSREIYSRVSKEIMAYLETKAEKLERASIDEAYLQPEQAGNSKSEYQNSKLNGWKYAEKLAKEIKKDILASQKLTCSIGIGPNKLVAKIASDRQKPDGLTVVRPEEVQKFLDPLPIIVIPGIGPKTQDTLSRLGIRRILDLRKLPKEKLGELFGKWGIEMWNRARGIDERPVTEEHEAKSIGEQETFDNDTLDSNFLVSRIKAISRNVFETVSKEGFKFRTVSIIVRFADFETKTRAHTLAKPVSDITTLQHEALQLFMPFLDKRENPKKKLIRLLGVRVEKLKKE